MATTYWLVWRSEQGPDKGREHSLAWYDAERRERFVRTAGATIKVIGRGTAVAR